MSGFCLACLHDFFVYVFDICHFYIETITIIAAFINKKDPIPTEIKPCKQFSAAADCGITFVCIQVKENSLGGFTADDAIVL